MARFGQSRVLPGVVPIPSGIPPFFFRARSRRRSCQRFAKAKGDEIEHGRGKRSDPLVASRLLAGGADAPKRDALRRGAVPASSSPAREDGVRGES